MEKFAQESEEELTHLNNALLDLEDDPTDAETIDEVFRTSHTLKGNFGMMGFPDASDLAHAMEDMLDEVREGTIEVTPTRMDLLFEGVDRLEMMLAEINENEAVSSDPTKTIDRIRASIDDTEGSRDESDDPEESEDPDLPVEALQGTGALDAEGGLFHVHVDVGESETQRVDAMFVFDKIDESYELQLARPPRESVESGEFDETFEVFLSAQQDEQTVAEFFRSSRYVESVEVQEVSDRLEAGGADRPSTGSESTSTSPTEDPRDDTATTESAATINKESRRTSQLGNGEVESIRVDVDQIDTLYNQVEEMVTSRIKLRQIIEKADSIDAEEELNEHDKITSRLQDTVLEMRLVPLRKVVGNFPRVVRDLAREQDKEIDFRMEGTDIEMDRSILNEMGDPLMHLIRNAVDHGIEHPDVRESKGKPPEGTIRLSGERERDQVRITVEDDGRGLDVEEIREKAIEQQVQPPDQIRVMDDSEVFDLLFHPGFSTTDEVTDVSGRGVGMDVVQEVVKGVDGSIDVQSEPDEGTSVTMTLPVSVAIVRVLFVESAGETYGIPIKNIDEISELRDVQAQTVENRDVITHDDRIYPVVHLGDALDVPDATNGADDMIIRVKQTVRQVAIRCESVIGQEEVVIKPFEGILSGTPGISGASVLGEGEVVIMLDVETL
jgi:two-component system chemotaxis sensor kinase CheA